MTEKERIAVIDAMKDEHRIIEKLYPESFIEKAYDLSEVFPKSIGEIIFDSEIVCWVLFSVTICYIVTVMYWYSLVN